MKNLLLSNLIAISNIQNYNNFYSNFENAQDKVFNTMSSVMSIFAIIPIIMFIIFIIIFILIIKTIRHSNRNMSNIRYKTINNNYDTKISDVNSVEKNEPSEKAETYSSPIINIDTILDNPNEDPIRKKE